MSISDKIPKLVNGEYICGCGNETNGKNGCAICKLKKRRKIRDRISKKEGETKKNGSGLGQLLYAADLLDGQIQSMAETGDCDTSIIFDIRMRLKSVMFDFDEE